MLTDYRRTTVALALLTCTIVIGGSAGCGSHQSKTVQTQTVEAADTASPDEAQRVPEAKTTTTTTTTEKDDSSPGVISSAAHLVWAVISLPFRLIGALV